MTHEQLQRGDEIQSELFGLRRQEQLWKEATGINDMYLVRQGWLPSDRLVDIGYLDFDSIQTATLRTITITIRELETEFANL